MDDGDTVHRLYPKVLASKWLLLIRQACIAYAEQHTALPPAHPSPIENTEAGQ
jgi:hypothetical protein